MNSKPPCGRVLPTPEDPHCKVLMQACKRKQLRNVLGPKGAKDAVLTTWASNSLAISKT